MPAYNFTLHVIVNMGLRGIEEHEVIDTVEAGDPVDTVGNRYIRRRVFTEGYQWYGRQYPHKEITAVYVVEGHRTVILTAIARYGRFEANYED